MATEYFDRIKNEAQRAYFETPISVLKYIEELEKITGTERTTITIDGSLWTINKI